MLLSISGHRELQASDSFRLQIAGLLPRHGTPLHLAVYVLLTACRVAGVQTCDSRQPSPVRFFAGVARLTHDSAEPSPFLLPAWKLNASVVCSL
jgi:hypothetical protein